METIVEVQEGARPTYAALPHTVLLRWSGASQLRQPSAGVALDLGTGGSRMGLFPTRPYILMEELLDYK